MALIQCPECGISVSNKGDACPRCAYPIRKLTNLFDAIRKSDEEMIADLLKSGADPNVTDEDGATPLMIAAYEGNEKIVKTLLGAGADPNLKRGKGITALMDAAYKGHVLVVRALLEGKADASILSDGGITAADLAKKKKHMEIKALLQQEQMQYELRQWQEVPEIEAKRIREAVRMEAPEETVEEAIEEASKTVPEQIDYASEQVKERLDCLKCAKPIGADDLVCPHCKAPILRKYCSRCSRLIPDHTSVCPFCHAQDTGRFHYHRHTEGIIVSGVLLIALTGLLFVNRPHTNIKTAKPTAVPQSNAIPPGDLAAPKITPTPAPVVSVPIVKPEPKPVVKLEPKPVVTPEINPVVKPRANPVQSETLDSDEPARLNVAEAERLNDRGYILMKQGRYREAVEVLRQAVASFPSGKRNTVYAYALYNLGRSLRLSGRPQTAIPILQERLKFANQRDVVARELQAAEREASEPGTESRLE